MHGVPRTKNCMKILRDDAPPVRIRVVIAMEPVRGTLFIQKQWRCITMEWTHGYFFLFQSLHPNGMKGFHALLMVN